MSSFDCASFKLIDELANSNFDRLIISTGATYDQIEKTVNILKKKSKVYTFTLYINISDPLKEAHLSRIAYLKKLNNDVGISDHSNYDLDGPKLSLAAVYFGATTVEKHFTLLEKSKTKDGVVSVNPSELKELVKLCKASKNDQKYIEDNIPELEKIMLGSSNRELSDIELLNRDYYQGRSCKL